MVKGKFKKFYEDFHRAKSLIAFLSQKTACPVYLFQASSSSPHKSNKTSVFQVMSTDPAAIWNVLAYSLSSIIAGVKIEPGTILFSFPSLANKCPEKEIQCPPWALADMGCNIFLSSKYSHSCFLEKINKFVTKRCSTPILYSACYCSEYVLNVNVNL